MTLQTTAITEFPNRHQRNVNERNKEYEPVFTEGEHYANMVNSEALIQDIVPALGDLKLSLLDYRGDIAADDIATFLLYDVLNNDARVAWDIASFPVLPEGRYRIVIFEEVTYKLYLASNYHQVINSERRLIDETAYLKYRHSASIYNYGYDELPDHYNRTRVHFNAVDFNQTFNSSEYEEVSTGESYNPRFDVDLQVEVETENYDVEAHKAFATFLAHNDLEINNKVYAVASGSKYSPERDKNSRIWNGKVSLKQVDFSTINKQ